jgi:hypothetical protein
MLLAIKCMSVAFLTGYLVGVPLLWLSRRGKPLTTTDWLYAPFVGLGTVTLITHQLAYLDVRVRWSAPAIWILTTGLWGALIARFGLRTPCRECPWRVILVTLAVYLTHGLGLVLKGPDEYVGRMQSDRYNYISLAQFLIDVPFSTDWNDVGQRPYLADGLKVKLDRIGVMALQAFFSVSSCETANRTFEATILLFPALVVPGLVLIGRVLNFGRAEALLAAIAGALVPAITTLHTFAFLANVSAIPFLFASLAAACTFVLEPSIRNAIVAAGLGASTASLYTEFAPLLVAVAGGAGLFGVLVGRCSWRPTSLALAGALLLVLLIYPKSELAHQLGPITRTTMNTSQGNPFWWLERAHLPGAAWVYDAWSINPPDSRREIVTGIGLGLSCLAVMGVLRLLGRELVFNRPPAGTKNGPAVMGVLVACLVAAPLVLLYDGRHDYQGAKLFLSLTPLLALGIAAAVRAPAGAPSRWWPWTGVIRRAGLVVPILVCGYGTSAMVYRLTKSTPAFVSAHIMARDASLRTLKDTLRSNHDRDIVLAVGPGAYLNSELAFAARRNHVWLACPVINDGVAVGCSQSVGGYRPKPIGRALVDLSTVPGEAVVVVSGDSPLLLIEGEKKLENRVGPYEVWHVGPGPYRLIPTELALRPPELDHPCPPNGQAQ